MRECSGQAFTIASTKRAEMPRLSFLESSTSARLSESQNSIVGGFFTNGKHAVDLDIISRFLSLNRNLPSNFIWKEFCK
jgi:hypothetical protein